MLAAVLALGTPLAHAHRPHEASLELRWLHGRWHARVLLPLPMATRLLADPAVPVLRAEDFPTHRVRLATLGAELFAASDGAGLTPRPATVHAELTPESEIALTFVVARGAAANPDAAAAPAASAPAPEGTPATALALEARFLAGLPAESFCLLRAWRDPDAAAFTQVLVSSSPLAEIAAASAPVVAPPARPSP